MLTHYTAAILDFDGTIYADGHLDIEYLRNLCTKYNYVIIASNNSTINHDRISRMVAEGSNTILITPQLITKAMLQIAPGKFETLANFHVTSFVNRNNRPKDDLILWKDKYNDIIRNELKYFASGRHIIIGKCSNQLIRDCIQERYKGVILMNKDKSSESKGLKKSSNMIGDILSKGRSICKNSDVYMNVLMEIFKDLSCKPAVVIGDNYNTDGRLAERLGIKFKVRTMTSHESRITHGSTW